MKIDLRRTQHSGNSSALQDMIQSSISHINYRKKKKIRAKQEMY